MIYFAIRHKPTGYFLPTMPNGRGYTWSEPEAPYCSTPRLFQTEVGAKRALGNWLQGRKQHELVGFGPDEEERLVTERRPNRKAEDMEVVRVEITIIS